VSRCISPAGERYKCSRKRTSTSRRQCIDTLFLRWPLSARADLLKHGVLALRFHRALLYEVVSLEVAEDRGATREDLYDQGRAVKALAGYQNPKSAWHSPNVRFDLNS
jgi:hypothetical protein